jgi:hypothetical protein
VSSWEGGGGNWEGAQEASFRLQISMNCLMSETSEGMVGDPEEVERRDRGKGSWWAAVMLSEMVWRVLDSGSG